MQNLANSGTIRRLLEEAGFSFKKSLGQNFLINPSVCPRMAEAACSALPAGQPRGVLEIGPGIGVLTVELARRADRVVAVELDQRLRPVLDKTLADFPNASVVFADVMKLDAAALIEERFAGMEVSVCANLPYYITSPILMMLLESRLPIRSITVMVQKEAAVRLCARPGTREAGAVTAAVSYYAQPEILFPVSAGSFLPAPKVDSAVIQLHIRKTPPVQVEDEAAFFALIRAAFAQRRKTLVNSVSAALPADKASLLQAMEAAGLPPDIRAERLSLEDFARLAGCMQKNKV
ncbi:MAG TPA: 16S rRNA (adenine(1518)-N(6)/adenine(1519)-N(6))-dimethyltransferase RsmA [Firmicutes bacterium]|nr:16S rRNA (adenine(1518)-N(6)/adenine(1519)-N(6))-dimethyltransferase RsmA [Bacillota bacterium]